MFWATKSNRLLTILKILYICLCIYFISRMNCERGYPNVENVQDALKRVCIDISNNLPRPLLKGFVKAHF